MPNTKEKNENTMYPHSVLIRFSPEDERYIAEVPELPGCKSDGESRGQALKNIQGTIDSWIDAAKREKRRVPDPDIYEKRELFIITVYTKTIFTVLTDKRGMMLCFPSFVLATKVTNSLSRHYSPYICNLTKNLVAEIYSSANPASKEKRFYRIVKSLPVAINLP